MIGLTNIAQMVLFLLMVALPVILVLANNERGTKSKITGAAISLLFSWIGFAAFMIATRKK